MNKTRPPVPAAPSPEERSPTCPAGLRNDRTRQLFERTGIVLDDETKLIIEGLLTLLQTCNAIQDKFNEWFAVYGLSGAKYNLLFLLKYAPDRRLSMAEIGKGMTVTRPNITQLVDGLERQGLVQRANLPCDRRVVLAELTPKGEALMDRIMPLHHQHLRELWSQMSETETLQLVHLLMKLSQSLPADRAR